MFLGDTVDRLIRKSPVPVLIVRDRAFEPYHTMLVATDFSESSRVALETAIRFFPDTGLSLFHAYDVPFAGYRSEEHTSEPQSLMRISSAVFCLKTKTTITI